MRLEKNNIGAAGAQALADALPTARLQLLVLDNNPIPVRGALAILNATAQQETREAELPFSLRIFGCEVGAGDAPVLAHMLENTLKLYRPPKYRGLRPGRELKLLCRALEHCDLVTDLDFEEVRFQLAGR